MKKILITILLALPILCNAQAHLGESLSGLRKRYPGEEIKIDYTKDGTKYALMAHDYGTFAYYFNNSGTLTDYCIQIPYNQKALSAQIEIYNDKYVIISKRNWKAYLEGGAVLDIILTYDEDMKNYIFHYRNDF
jgi:hypothetical protein